MALDPGKVRAVRDRVEALTVTSGRRPRIVVGKPGLDGHSNGAEMIALAARHCGLEVIYSGIRLAPAAIARQAVEEDASVIGLSVLSGSHLEVTRQLRAALAAEGAADLPVVVGGIVPDSDVAALAELGVEAVFTPRDYDLADILDRVVAVIERSGALPPPVR
jgi:(2R)-ethylmalonyl-CoA mutase